MYRHLIRHTTIALGTLLVGSTLVFAASVPGTVTARDGKGMATVRTSDGKDHQVRLLLDSRVLLSYVHLKRSTDLSGS